MAENAPLVSVVMPVYNDSATLLDAVNSIVQQSFLNWELIVVDDGSTDPVPRLLASIEDRRIKVIRKKENHGIAAALNEGISQSRGALIARMDADDISLPQRLQMQVQFMNEHPEISLLGTQVLPFTDVKLPRKPPYRLPTRPAHIRLRLHWANCFGHPTVMGRRDLFESSGGYNDLYKASEDYDLWLRSSPSHRMANLETPLLYLRVRRHSLSRRESMALENNAAAAAAAAASSALGENVSRKTALAMRSPAHLKVDLSLVNCILDAATTITKLTTLALATFDVTPEDSRLILQDARYRLAQLYAYTRQLDRGLASQMLRESPLLTRSSLIAAGVASMTRKMKIRARA